MAKTGSKQGHYCSSGQGCTELPGKWAARNVLNKVTWEQQEQGEMEMRAEMLLRQTAEIALELPAYVSNSWLVKEF